MIEMVNGTASLSVPDVYTLLRGQADKQVLMRVKPKAGRRGARRHRGADLGPARRRPPVRRVGIHAPAGRRAGEPEHDRLRAPARHGRRQHGGVDARVLPGLQPRRPDHRRPPQQRRQHRQLDPREAAPQGRGSTGRTRVGSPTWNMQFAFRGHMVVLVNERTASDGEAFAEGFRRLGLGKVIGTRTWGGEIWLRQKQLPGGSRHRDRGRDRASTARRGSGSSKGTASTPTSWWTTCRRRPSTGRTRSSRRRSSTCRS